MGIILSNSVHVSLYIAFFTFSFICFGYADQYRSNGTGNWSAPGTWQISTDGGSTWNASATTPGNHANDTVLIRDSHTVTIDANFQISKLTLGGGVSGTLVFGTTNRTDTVTGSIFIAVGAQFTSGPAGITTHSLSFSGDTLTNNGTLNMRVVATRVCDWTFNKNGNQVVNGAGATYSFDQITVNLGASKSNILEVKSVITMLAATASPTLTLNNGTFKLSSASTITPFGGNITLPATAGYFLNAACTSNWGNLGDLVVEGDLTVVLGTLNVSSSTNNALKIGVTGTVSMSGGAVNVNGRLQADTTGGTLTISGGVLTIPAGGTVNTSANSIFQITGSTFNMTNGTVSVNSPNANTTLADVNINPGSGSITGGLLQITTGAVAKTISVSSTIPVFNFTVVNGAAAVVALLRDNPLVVSGALTVTSGTLDAGTNNINIQVKGNWTNSGTYSTGTNTVTLNGTVAQTLGGTSSSTFNNLTIANSVSVTLGRAITVNGNLTVNTGTFIDGGFQVTGNAAGTMTMAAGTGLTLGVAATATAFPINFTNANIALSATSTVTYNSNVAQTISGVPTYGNLTLAATAAVTKTFGAATTIAGALTIGANNTLDVSASNFAVNIAGNWTNNSAAAAFTARAGTVAFNGIAVQTLGGTQSTSFNNLTLSNNVGVTLGHAETVTGNVTVNNGTLADGGFQITGNAAGTMTMAAGTGLTLGTAATATAFPTNFTNANIALSATSTVTYNSNVAQTISGVPTYWNLTLAATAAVTKTLGAAATVNGNLTVNANNTMADGGFQITGNATGTMTMAAGTGLTLGTVATATAFPTNFTNANITLSATSTVTYNSNVAQTISGVPAYGNLTLAATAAVTKTLGAAVTINGNLTLNNLNTLDVSASNFGINLGGNWNAVTGSVFTPRSGVVTFNGTGAQQILGTLVTKTYYDVVLNKTSGTLLNTAGSTTTVNVNNLTMTQGNFTPPATLGIAASFTGTAGTLTAGTNINISGDWTNNGVTFTPGANTVTFNSTTAAQGINGTAVTQTFNNLVVNKTGQTLSVGGSTTTLTVNAGFTLTAGSFTAPATLSVAGALTLTAGTLTAGAAINVGGNWSAATGTIFTPGTGTVTFNGAGAQQILGTLVTETYKDVVINKTSGTLLNTAGSTTTVNVNNLTMTQGNFTPPATLGIAASFTGTAGTLTAGTNINISGDWTNNGVTFTPGANTVTFNSTTAGQGINGTAVTQTFNNLVVNKTGQTLSVGGSTTTLTINTGLTLTAGTFAAGTATAINLAGNWTNNSGAAAFTASASTVTLNGGSPQSIGGAFSLTFNNLTVNNGNGISLNSNLTVSGTLTLTSGNLAVIDPNVLTMGASATTVGAGDVTGIVKRTTLVAGTTYTFGNQYSTINFRNVGTLPTEMSARITIGSAPSWKTGAVKRTFEMIQSGASGSFATTTTHYLDAELNGNTESKLVLWGCPYPFTPGTEMEFGRSNYDTTNNWVGMSGVDVAQIPSSFGQLTNTFGDSKLTNATWNGSTSTTWVNAGNWTPSGVPSDLVDVVIPDASGTTYEPTMPIGALAVGRLTINSGGILNATATSTVTISGGSGAWSNNGGTFNPSTSTVIFTNAAATISGATDFYNVTINSGAALLLGSGGTMRIGGTVTNNGTWRAAQLANNTVEYNGGSQTVLNPNGLTPGYDNLILSGTGTKTMPGTAVNISGNFTLGGTASATAGDALTVGGDVTLGAGTTFNASTYTHNVAGNFTNGAIFTAATSTVNFNGSSSTHSVNGGSSSFNNLTHSGTDSLHLVTSDLSVAGNLTNSGGFLDANGKNITVGGNWANSATFSPGSGTVTLNGSSPQTMSGSTFNNLTVGNAAGVSLLTNENVNGTLTIADGSLTTGADTVLLGSAGTLSESTGKGVVGNVRTTRTVLQSVNNSFGGLGVEINAAGAAPGSTTVTRQTGTQLSGMGGTKSIKRSFDITPSTNTGLNANLVYHYDNTELAGEDPTTLQLFKSTDNGSTWTYEAGSVDTTGHTISQTGFNGFSKWTGADGSNVLGNTPLPTTTSINPTSKTLDDAQFTLTVNGTNFVRGQSTVLFNGGNRTTTFVNETNLSATILASDLTSAGSFPITVFNAGGGGASNSQTFTVNKASPTVTLRSSLNPSTFEQSVTFTAHVTNASHTPTGSVTFYDSATSLGNVSLTGDSALVSVSTLTAGSHTVKAVYGGDSNFKSDSTTLGQTVNKKPTTSLLTSSLSTSTYGQPVTFKDSVAGSIPDGGKVLFKVDGTASGDSVAINGSGVAIKIITNLTVGTHSVQAYYGGTNNFDTSRSNTLSQVVNKIATTGILSSALNPSIYGQAVMLTDSVTGSPDSGTVQFKDGNNNLGSPDSINANGVAVLTASLLNVAPHNITAIYSGTSSRSSNTSNVVVQVVWKKPTSNILTSSLNPLIFGQSVTFRDSVTGSPVGGSVVFKDGNVSLGVAVPIDSTGVATISAPGLLRGPHFIRALYSGTSNFTGSVSDTLVELVNPKPTSSVLVQSSSTSLTGDTVTFVDSVSSHTAPDGGTVQFKDNASDLGNPTAIDVNGIALMAVTTLSPGSHTITAEYSGTNDYTPSTSNAVVHAIIDSARYRSISALNLTNQTDNLGKADKYVLQKPDKVYFNAQMVNDATSADGLYIEFSTGIDVGHPFVIVPAPASAAASDRAMQKWFVTFADSVRHGDTVKVYGWGVRSKLEAIVRFYWMRGAARSSLDNRNARFLVNALQLPMPNNINVLYESYAYGGFTLTNGLLVGRNRSDSAKYFGWVRLKRYTDVLKSLKDRSGVHSCTPRPFDFYTSGCSSQSNRPITREQGTLPPSKQNNTLFADMVALKLNIVASELNVTPVGFGELVYDDGMSTSLDGMTLGEIAAYGDSLISGYLVDSIYLRAGKPTTVKMRHFANADAFVTLDSVIAKVNSAFEGPMDTVKFADTLRLTGVKGLGDVSYLHRDPHLLPARIVPILGNDAYANESPVVYHVYQNFPNPFNPTTTIRFDLPEPAMVTVKVYNILGQEVSTLVDHQAMDDGTQEVQFDGERLTSGVYFYRVIAEGMNEDGMKTSTFMTVKKMLMIK